MGRGVGCAVLNRNYRSCSQIVTGQLSVRRHARVTETTRIHAYADTCTRRQAGRQARRAGTHASHSDRVDGPVSRKGDKSTVPFKVRGCPGPSKRPSNTHRRPRRSDSLAPPYAYRFRRCGPRRDRIARIPLLSITQRARERARPA